MKLTREILRELERKGIEIKDLSKKSIVREMFENLEENEIDITNVSQLIELKIKELFKRTPNGISDSIMECLENMGDETYRKMLIDLTKSY